MILLCRFLSDRSGALDRRPRAARYVTKKCPSDVCVPLEGILIQPDSKILGPEGGKLPVRATAEDPDDSREE
jgi:hypothetical protein